MKFTLNNQEEKAITDEDQEENKDSENEEQEFGIRPIQNIQID